MSAEREYWKQMEALREQMEAEEHAASKAVEQVLREEAERKQNLVERGIQILVEIFTQIKDNKPEIKEASFSEIDDGGKEVGPWVSLHWGKKLTPEPQDIFISAVFETRSEEDPGMTIPDSIVLYDYHYIHAMVSPVEVHVAHKRVRDPRGQSVFLVDTFSLDEFVGNPMIALPAITRALRNPIHAYRELRKGVDYWKDPSKPM